MKARYTWLHAVLLALAFIPFIASAACAGKDADLQSWAGKYLADHNLLATPAIASRLQRLSEKERLHLQRNLAQPRSVHFHVPPVSTSNAAGKAAAVKININKDAIKPTPAQTKAIRRAAASDIKEFIHPNEAGYLVAVADLNDDGRPDLLVQFSNISFCGSSGCSGVIVMATPNGYDRKPIGLPNFGGEIDVLPTKHQGMHDLRFNGDSPVWQWNGKEYDVAKADLPQSNAPAWQTRQAPGHPLIAVATPIDSTIRNLLVFCEQGHPLLAMVTKMPRPEGPVTLTFVFRGWSVNVPMQRNRQTEMLWTADLSRSELPQWLAHRGTNATTSKLAGLATQSFVRINGDMQGEISLEHSTQATQAALGACYRY